MTLKELKNDILRSLYKRYKDNIRVTVSIIALAKEDNLIFDNENQLIDAVKALMSSGFVNATIVAGDARSINLLPEGVEYVEENLLTLADDLHDGFRDSDQAMNKGYKLDIDDSNTNDSESQRETEPNRSYEAIPYFKKIIDKDVQPCFGIDALAKCYVEQMSKIADSSNEAVPMLGIFGPWGRGKTYFFSRIKNILSKSKDKNYTVIEFNAWKYRDTPALWAYLYETIYKSADWCAKSCLYIQNTIGDVLKILFLFALAWGLSWLLSLIPGLGDKANNLFKELSLPIAWVGLFGSFIYSYINNPTKAFLLLKKYTTRRSFHSEMGIQNEIEQHLEQLIVRMVKMPKRDWIVLYVDDIDRCSSNQMLEIIDSLRVILENEEIRKRLIVVCSVDEEKLKTGFAHKYKGVYLDETLKKMAREHLEKLFVFGVKLPRLDVKQQCEFVHSLIHPSENKPDEYLEIHTSPHSTSRHKESFIPIDVSCEVLRIDDSKIEKILDVFIRKHNLKLTPRQIRILYYRLLMACNIAAARSGKITSDTLDEILELSTCDYSLKDTKTASSDIIEMVVAY